MKALTEFGNGAVLACADSDEQRELSSREAYGLQSMIERARDASGRHQGANGNAAARDIVQICGEFFH